MAAAEWLELLLEPGTLTLHDEDVTAALPSPLAKKLPLARERSGASESVTHASGMLAHHPVAVAVVDFDFLGGSLGVAAGERLARALEHGAHMSGAIALCASGGVRVHEGMAAVLQMTRVVAARQLLAQSRRPLLAVLCDPSFGGIAVSIGGTADVTLALSGARIGYSGPRAVAALGGHARVDTAEQACELGLIDAVVDRGQVKDTLRQLLDVLGRT